MPNKLSDEQLFAYLVGLSRQCSYDFDNIELDQNCPLKMLRSVSTREAYEYIKGMTREQMESLYIYHQNCLALKERKPE